MVTEGWKASWDLSINATVILLVKPCYFDDEKEKAAQKTAEKTAEQAGKCAADGQLQPALNK